MGRRVKRACFNCIYSELIDGSFEGGFLVCFKTRRLLLMEEEGCLEHFKPRPKPKPSKFRCVSCGTMQSAHKWLKDKYTGKKEPWCEECYLLDREANPEKYERYKRKKEEPT